MMLGPTDAESIHTEQSMKWKLKRKSIDVLYVSSFHWSNRAAELIDLHLTRFKMERRPSELRILRILHWGWTFGKSLYNQWIKNAWKLELVRGRKANGFVDAADGSGAEKKQERKQNKQDN
jgi:hypothetical protein